MHMSRTSSTFSALHSGPIPFLVIAPITMFSVLQASLSEQTECARFFVFSVFFSSPLLHQSCDNHRKVSDMPPALKRSVTVPPYKPASLIQSETYFITA